MLHKLLPTTIIAILALGHAVAAAPQLQVSCGLPDDPPCPSGEACCVVFTVPVNPAGYLVAEVCKLREGLSRVMDNQGVDVGGCLELAALYRTTRNSMLNKLDAIRFTAALRHAFGAASFLAQLWGGTSTQGFTSVETSWVNSITDGSGSSTEISLIPPSVLSSWDTSAKPGHGFSVTSAFRQLNGCRLAGSRAVVSEWDSRSNISGLKDDELLVPALQEVKGSYQGIGMTLQAAPDPDPTRPLRKVSRLGTTDVFGQ
ncbi:hypothetical protein C8R47DRAFT_1064182 [Mycena vitilis]|nr:hypothetical protein C8R47DRAFT_1064182 [Mycena vitilis]